MDKYDTAEHALKEVRKKKGQPRPILGYVRIDLFLLAHDPTSPQLQIIQVPGTSFGPSCTMVTVGFKMYHLQNIIDGWIVADR